VIQSARSPRPSWTKNYRPRPRGEIEEEALLAFIVDVVHASKRLYEAERGLGNRKKTLSPITQILRGALELWETRDHGKFSLSRPRSKDSEISEIVEYDHAVPISIIVQQLLTSPAESDHIRAILDNLLYGCVISDREHKALNAANAGLRERMPEDWNGRDRLARYRRVGIDIVDPSDCEPAARIE
jgi:hypothetical protein